MKQLNRVESQNSDAFSKFQKISVLVLVLGCLGFYLRSAQEPLLGVHRWRQADTLFASYYYCKEKAPFLLPKIAPRENTNGVGIGEFPLYSYLISLKCQVTGQWDEVFPKLMQLLIFAALVWSWGSYIRRRYKDLQFSAWVWVPLAAFMPNALRFHTIALPDGFALLLVSLAAHLWLSAGVVNDALALKKQLWPLRFSFGDLRSLKVWLGILVFWVSFLIRPYYCFFIVWILTSNLVLLLTTLGSGALYVFWFKHWIHLSDLAQYYGTQLRSLSTLQSEWPKAFPGLITGFVWDVLSYLGLWFFIKGVRKDGRLILALILCLIILPTFRGSHFLTHRYYMLGGGLLAAVIMMRGYAETQNRWKGWAIVIMMLISISAVQHNWQPDRKGYKEAMRREASAKMSPGEKLVTYHQFNPEWLYYPLREGWTLDMSAYSGPRGCPRGAQWAMIVPSEPSEFRLERCEPNRKGVNHGD